MLDSSSELESLANSIKFNSAPRLQGNWRRRDREMAQRSCKTEGRFRSNDLKVFALNRLQLPHEKTITVKEDHDHLTIVRGLSSLPYEMFSQVNRAVSYGKHVHKLEGSPGRIVPA